MVNIKDKIPSNDVLRESRYDGFKAAALGGGAAVFLWSMMIAPSQFVIINGSRKFVPTLEHSFEVPLHLFGIHDGLSVNLSREELVEMYHNVDSRQYFSVQKFVTFEHLEPVADLLLEKSKGDKLAYIGNVLDFINRNVTYCSDVVEYYRPTLFGEPDLRLADYPKFPLQTLLDKCGDCEDFSILAASFFAYANIETGLAGSLGHAAVGFAVEDGKSSDRVVFDVAARALGKNFTSSLGKNSSMAQVQVRLETPISELEGAVQTQTPLIVGRRDSFPIHVIDYVPVEVVPTVPCDDLYWTGGMDLRFVEIERLPRNAVLMGLRGDNKIGDVLGDAITQRNRDESLSVIYYQFPTNPQTYLVAAPSNKLNRDSNCVAERREGSNFPNKFVGWADTGDLGITTFKSHSIYYLEPQQTGFTLYSHIPFAVRWDPLPAEKYNHGSPP